MHENMMATQLLTIFQVVRKWGGSDDEVDRSGFGTGNAPTPCPAR